MYKAIKNIGEYKVGETVPDEKAEAWLAMYAVPHVEKVITPKATVENPKPKAQSPKVNSLLIDFLERNQAVVKKNIESDNLSKVQLTQMLGIERNDKNRPLVIQTIKSELKKL